VIEALDKRVLNPDRMITGIFELGDAQKGFEIPDREPEKHLKILLRV
jgi:hypothetical protein